jgi:AraC-like DNA-binding protein
MYSVADAPVMELHFTLHNDAWYNLQGLGEVRFPERHFNMTYVPYIKNKVLLKESSHYTMLDIQFTPAYLERFAQNYPMLADLLTREKRGAAGMLTPTHTAMTTRMDDIVLDMLRSEFKGDMKTIFLQNRVEDLLIHVLQRLGSDKKVMDNIQLSPQDMEKIRHARDYILFNIDKPGSLEDIARVIGMNEFKLKKGFKQLYNTTLFDFLLDVRIDKARLLLMETNMSLYEVAIATGYKSVPAFTTAFRKKTGYSPRSLKKRGEADIDKWRIEPGASWNAEWKAEW